MNKCVSFPKPIKLTYFANYAKIQLNFDCYEENYVSNNKEAVCIHFNELTDESKLILVNEIGKLYAKIIIKQGI